MVRVYQETCTNCLLSKNRIVSPKVAKEIISSCAKNRTFFICHKSSVGMNPQGDNICCRTFYDKLGYLSQSIRIAERLNILQFVNQPDSEKLPTWNEMEGDKNER